MPLPRVVNKWLRRFALCRCADAHCADLRCADLHCALCRCTLCRCADVHCAGLHCALCRCAGQQTMATARARLILCWTLHRNSSGTTRTWTHFCNQELRHSLVGGAFAIRRHTSPKLNMFQEAFPPWCFLFRGSNQFQANTSLSFGVSNVVFENIRSIVEMRKLIGGNYARPSRSISGRQ